MLPDTYCADYAPTRDGVLLPSDSIDAILGVPSSRTASLADLIPAAVPTLFGHNPQDAMLFQVGTDDGRSGTPLDPDVADTSNYIAYVNASIRTRGYLRGFPAAADAALSRVLTAYPPSTNASNGAKYLENLAMLGKLTNDVEFVCGVQAFAGSLNMLGVSAWQYLFAYNATFKRPCDLSFPAEYGVCHTMELPVN